MPCVCSSRMVKNYRIFPIRIEIIHGRHRVVQMYTWAGPLYSNFTPSDQELGPFPDTSAIQLKISSGDGFCYLSPTCILKWVVYQNFS